jgi:hypothetical protein
MTVDLRAFVLADKLVPVSRGWEQDERDYLSWVSPLDVDGVTTAGLRVRIRAHELRPNEAVCVQLEYFSPGGKSEGLARVEWKPLRPHNNKGKGPPEFQFKPFRKTHAHRFDMNWNDNAGRLFTGNLPVAIPIQDVDSFEKFLDICAIELKILNLSIVPMPPWHQRML